jgi:acylphosphatase
MRIARRIIIFGRVQGVGYRHWAVGQAQALGLDGYVRNLPDRSVEAVVSGSEEAVMSFAGACRRGPRLAAVDRVEISDAEEAEIDAGFRQLPTR